LPRDVKSNLFTDLDLHVFGTVPRYRLSAVKKQLEDDEYRLRSETLAAVRKCTREELAEPSLSQLRARIEKVVNNILAEAPVKEVGFYQVTLRQR
jgi:flagellar basal body-associated protein FliL